MALRDTLVRMNTTRNVGRWDRVVRSILPFVVLALWWAHLLPAVAAIPLGIVTVMLFPTAFTGACSIYYALGVSTCPRSGARATRS